MKPVLVRPEGSDSVKPPPTCYVCGCPRCAEYPLAVRQQPSSGPYFPFLETHEPPDGSEPPTPEGIVRSCYLCYSYLRQQWQLYERDKVPPVKRIYWLKRVDNGPYTGVEVGVQSEYASQLLGLTPDPPAPPSAPAPAPEVKRQGPSGSTRPHPPPHTPVAIAPPVEVKRPRINPPQPQPPSMPLPPPGVPPLPLGLATPQVGTQQEALDLSLEGRRGVKREREDEPARERGGGRTEVLDLRMPDKNATTEVCYVCGDHHKKGTLVDIYATQQSGACPFFPSLTQHPRPSKSHPMEASGRVQACRDCMRHLQAQWDTYEAHKVPHAKRDYSLRRRTKSMVQDSTRFVCYKCGREHPSSALCLLYCRPNSEKEPYYPFFEKLEPPEGASPISPQGMVQVCSSCSHTISLQAHTDTTRKSPVRGSTDDGSGEVAGGTEQSGGMTVASALPVVPRPPSVSAPTACRDTDSQVEEATCYLCHQNHSRQAMHWLSMVPESATQDRMYFSFLKHLPRIGQNSVVEGGRVLACSLCHQHLTNQWAEYEKDKVTEEHRQFSLRVMTINSPSPRLTPGPSLSSPGMSPTADGSPPHCFSSAAEAHLKSTSLDSKKPGGYNGQPLHTLEVVPTDSDSSTPTLPVITTQRALNIAINCFVCSFHSKPGQTYALRSKPVGTEPFFPFLAKHQSAHPEARVDESCVLSCHCCFHSLILQWQRYEKEQVAHYARLYDTYNYTCFICSLKTYRKRLYLLPVKDYPFLKEHNRPSGGMVVDSGHSVVVCKDCYSSLKSQYLELERWGVPVEKRQYNWIQRPPPPEFQQDPHAKSIQVFPSGTQPSGAEPGSSSPGSHPGTPPGPLTQPGGGGSPRDTHGPVPLGSSSAASESVVQGGGGRSNDTATLAMTSALKTSPPAPPITTSADTTPSAGSSTPSCHAPLHLQSGIARQGGATQPSTLTKHTVASCEGVNSGGTTKQPRTSDHRKLDQMDHHHRPPSLSTKSSPSLPPHKIPNNHLSSPTSQTPTLIELEGASQIIHKKRKSVIRAMSNSAVPTSNSNGNSSLSSQLSSLQLLLTSQELQAKCSLTAIIVFLLLYQGASAPLRLACISYIVHHLID